MRADFVVTLPHRQPEEECRRWLLRHTWVPSPRAAAWKHSKVEQQPPVLVRAKGSLPGLKLVMLLEQAMDVCLGRAGGDEAEDAKALRLNVAREVLHRQTLRTAIFFLALQ